MNIYIYHSLLLHFIIQLNGAFTTADAEDDYYTAGVVEFCPAQEELSPSAMLADNLRGYLEIVESKDANDTDIIVFPEGTLNNVYHLTYVPSEKDHITPCLVEDGPKIYAEFLIEISCTARRVRKYLVINLSEKENCPANSYDTRPCTSNGLNIYNTNVVFDREGRVVSRYRKTHVYVEIKNTTMQPEYGIFQTDFGVTFGHFICFDILFYTPAQELVDRFNITDIIFTSYFYSELPFLTASQLQQGWAWGNNVNFLVAGASFPQTGTTGSGIYAGNQGTLISVMAKQEGERKLFKAQIPKKFNSKRVLKKRILGKDKITKRSQTKNPEANQKLNLKLLKDPQIQNYNSILLNPLEYFVLKEKLCFKEFCCYFEITGEVIRTPSYFYRIGVFDGRRTYQKEEWSDIKVCSLYACTSQLVESCGEIPEELHNLLFHKIHIKGSFPDTTKLLIMPNTLDNQLYTLETEELQWEKRKIGSFYEVDLELTKDHSNLLTFGIYSMYFEKSRGNRWTLCHILTVFIIVFITLTV